MQSVLKSWTKVFGPRLARRWALRVALLVLLVPIAAHAIDSARTAVTLVQQAAKSYESGDFVKAADLYEKAWRLDPSPAYLWALARSEHLAGLNENAIDHYRQFITNPGAESARLTKAQAYLADVEQEVNKTRLREADAATRSSNPALAAELYLQAYKTAPGRLDWLFKAAVAEQMAENFPAALQHLETYLSLATNADDDRGQATARAAWLRQKLGVKAPPPQTKEAPPPLPTVLAPGEPHSAARTPGVVQPAEPAARPTWPGWTALGGGAAFLAGGVALLVTAQADAAQLTRDQSHDPGQLITAMSRETALNRASAINTRLVLGATATGLGVAAAGFGTWWLARHPAQTAVVLPSPNGALLAVRF